MAKNLMRTIIVLLGILLLTLAACAPGQESQQEDLPNTVSPSTIEEPEPIPPVEEALPPAPIEVEEPEPEPVRENSKDVVDLLGLADKRVKGYKYTYQGPPDSNLIYTFLVKGDRVRVDLPKSSRTHLENYFDTVFLNTADETAIGKCVEKSTLRCPDNEKSFAATYSSFFRRTPYQWISLVEYADLGKTQMIDSRNTVSLITTIDGKDTTLWVDSFYGLPLQVEQGEDLIEFRQMVVNQVTDGDVTP